LTSLSAFDKVKTVSGLLSGIPIALQAAGLRLTTQCYAVLEFSVQFDVPSGAARNSMERRKVRKRGVVFPWACARHGILCKGERP